MSTPVLRVGDRVSYKIGNFTFRAVVIGDRGNLGVRGRQIVTIFVEMRDADPLQFEMPSEELTLESSAA